MRINILFKGVKYFPIPFPWGDNISFQKTMIEIFVEKKQSFYRSYSKTGLNV